jgi:hypothetical protein
MEQIIDSLILNTQTKSVYVILKNDNYKHKPLKYFLNFKNEKVYFVGTEKNKTIFRNTEDIEKINNYLNN